MARKAHTLNPLLDNETAIRKHLERQTGEMVVYGWKAKRIDSRIAVAAYSYSITLSLEECVKRLERNIKLLLSENVKEIEERSYVFEVNLEGGIVRFINEDDRLMNKYAPGRGLGPSVNKTVEKWLSTVPKKNEDGEKH